jgi:hypothetical protein
MAFVRCPVIVDDMPKQRHVTSQQDWETGLGAGFGQAGTNARLNARANAVAPTITGAAHSPNVTNSTGRTPSGAVWGVGESPSYASRVGKPELCPSDPWHDGGL